MAEIATLGLRVDATGAIQAVNQFTTEVNKAGLGAAALDVEVKRVSGDLALARQHFQQGKISVSDYATAVSQAKREMGQLNAVQSAATPVNQRIAQSSAAVGSAFNASSAGANRLASALGPLVAQATGANPIMSRLASTVGILGIGSTVMVGVLLGIAALGAAWTLATSDTKKHTEEVDKLIKKYKEAADARMRANGAGARMDFGQLMTERETVLAKRKEVASAFRADSEGTGESARTAELFALDKQLTELAASMIEAARQTKEARDEVAAKALADRKAIEATADAAAKARQQESEKQQKAFDKLLDSQLRSMAARQYSREFILQGRPSTLRESMQPPGVGRLVSGITIPGSIGTPITKPSTSDPSKANQGAIMDWGAAAKIGGGIILGSGLAGNGYAASALSGGMSLAAQGAMLGSVVPVIGTAVGAVVGGVAGMVSGLFGHAKQVREAAEIVAQAQKAFDQDLKTRMLMAQGMTDEAETVRRLATNEKELAEARKAGMSASSLAVLRQVQAEEALAAAAAKAKHATDELAASIQKMRDTMNDLTERAYTAAGQGSVGARIGLVYRQGKEMAGASPELREATGIVQQMELARFDAQVQVDAINNAADAQIKALDAQRSISEDGLRVAQDQLSAQEKTIDAMQRVVDSLDEYSNSLKIGPLSVLSPYKQLQESRSQFDMLTALAKGGDLTAAASLPGAGNALLQSSRAFNASGPGYVADYNRVQSQITNIRDQFSGQISTAQQSLSELKAQTVLLQGVIAAIGAEKLRIDVQRNAEIDNVWKGFTERVDKWLTAFQTAMALLQTNMPKMTDAEFSAAFPTNKSGTNTEPAVGANPNPEDSDAITAARFLAEEMERNNQKNMNAIYEAGERNRLALEAASITPQYNEGL